MRPVALLLGLGLVAAVPVFTVSDPRISEDSGMVDLGPLTVVTNDSGDIGRVFVLDARGRTVGVTTYADPGPAGAVDVEALAPAGGGAVWVGDIGDNAASRDDVVVRRVPVARGDHRVDVAAYRLVYPDGPHDAETLLRDPSSGRLYLVTKAFSGGRVYAAPRRLDPDGANRLAPAGRVGLYATDGSFLADGHRVLLRGYGDAELFAFPSWRLLDTFTLPAQPQGESLSVGPGGRVRIGSEGRDQPVLQVDLGPAPGSGGVGAGSSRSPPRAGDTEAPAGQGGTVARAARPSPGPGVEPVAFWSVLAAVVAAGAGLLVVRRRGRRGR